MRFWTFPLLALTLAAQTPSFEVVSIRPTGPPTTDRALCGGGSFNVNPETVLSTENSQLSGIFVLRNLFIEAYQDEADAFDYPEWTRTGPFTVSVLIPPNTSVRTCRQMMQTLLAERFHVVTGVETRDVLRYYLKVAKSGLKLKPVDNPPADLNDSVKSEVKNGVSRRTYRGAPMSGIRNSLGTFADREASAHGFRLANVDRLVDETGLTGYYDGEFKLEYSVASRRDELAESLEDALTRQLGLTVELRKVPGKVLVLRSAERMPTEN